MESRVTHETKIPISLSVTAIVAMVLCAACSLLALALWLVAGIRTGPRVTFNVQPAGANVLIDNQIIGQTPLIHSLQPGEYRVRIEREHYIPWETTISVEDMDVSLERVLVFQPFASTLTQGALHPHWTPDGALLYITKGSTAAIVQWDSTGARMLTEFPAFPTSVIWSRDGSHIAAFTEVANYLDVFSVKDNGVRHIADSAFNPAWKFDGRTLTFTGWLTVDSPQYTVWSVEPGSAPLPLVVEIPSEMSDAEKAAWSPDGEWLFTISEDELAIWQMSENRILNSGVLPDVRYADWSPNASQLNFAYIASSDNSLLLVNPQRLSPTTIALNVTPPIRWSPDGTTLYYFDYRPEEGGSALWAINSETGNRTLLADAAIAIGEVIDFAVSPDGKRVAYVTDDYRLVLLTLGE